MTLREACEKSTHGMAEHRSLRSINRPMAMEVRPGEYRIIKGFTDPTVVRKLRPSEIDSVFWQPVESK